MPLDHDGKQIGPAYAGGPLPVRPSDDLPRWAVILVVATALTLFLALIRFAIDLLGVVFLIILVGFSIRTISDWLTESEAVSAWAVSAVSMGLLGTMLVGLWVFSSPDISGTTVTDRLPEPVVNGIHWLEARGWGQRVLLSRPPTLNPETVIMASRAASVPSASAAAGGSRESPASESVSEPVHPRLPSVRMPARSKRDPSEAEAATLESRSPTGPSGTAVVVNTAIMVKSWPTPAVVGKSVRLTATVVADSSMSPAGSVTFYSDGTALGSVPVNRTGPGRGEAALVTLSLPIGAHEITAQFSGASGFSGSQASPLTITLVRQ